MELTEIEAMFKHLGLTQYESKALIALISSGRCTADRVSSLAGIPLPRVYDTMNSLAKRGFISVSKTRPEVFSAIDPKRLFEILEDEERKSMEERVGQLKDLMPQILKQVKKMEMNSPEETGEILAVVKKRVNLRKDREDFHNAAKKEIIVFAGDMSWVRNVEDLVRSAIKRKVRYQVIFSKKGKSIMSNANRFKRLGAKVRYSPDIGELRCIIFDRRLVSIVLKKYRTTGESEYSVVNIDHPLIADVFAKYFYILWDRAGKV